MNKKINDPFVEARKNPKFKEYYQDARGRIDLAVEIYNLRKQKGLSQQGLARKAFTTQKIISKIENAQINVGWDLIARIVGSLGLKLKIIDSNAITFNCMNSYGEKLRSNWENVNARDASSSESFIDRQIAYSSDNKSSNKKLS